MPGENLRSIQRDLQNRSNDKVELAESEDGGKGPMRRRVSCDGREATDLFAPEP